MVPIQCEYYALEGVSQLMRTIQRVKGNLNDRLQLTTVLLTMFDNRTNLSHEVAGEVRAHFGKETLDVEIPRSVRIAEAPSYGQSVLTYYPQISRRGCLPQSSRGDRPCHHDRGRSRLMARGKQHVGLGKGLGDLFARTDEENTRDTTAPSDRLRDGSYFRRAAAGPDRPQSPAAASRL